MLKLIRKDDKKMNKIKRLEFIKIRGYLKFKRLSQMCKFFNIKLDDMLGTELDKLDILLSKENKNE